MPINCTRVMLYNISLSARGKKWLDIGIVTNQHHELALPIVSQGRGGGPGDVAGVARVSGSSSGGAVASSCTQAERVPMYEHPKWKYLINGDGVVASSR